METEMLEGTSFEVAQQKINQDFLKQVKNEANETTWLDWTIIIFELATVAFLMMKWDIQWPLTSACFCAFLMLFRIKIGLWGDIPTLVKNLEVIRHEIPELDTLTLDELKRRAQQIDNELNLVVNKMTNSNDGALRGSRISYELELRKIDFRSAAIDFDLFKKE